MVDDKKQLLIYAHYYIPDMASTGQILRELSEGMLDKFDITVICVVPSYLGTIDEQYKKHRFYKENINGVNLIRVRVPEFNKTDKISRVKNILSYFWGARQATCMVKNIDYVLAISQPPILGGLLGVYGQRMLHAKFIYNIQDFNPEQVMAVNYSKNKLIISIMMCLDKYSCRKSNLIITVGRDLVETVHKRFQGKKIPKIEMINNWVNEKEIYPLEDNNPRVLEFKEKYGLQNKFVFMYSGNLGLYYDLMNLIHVVEKCQYEKTVSRNFKKNLKTPDGREVIFAFVGDGSERDELVRYVEEHHVKNCVFIPYQDKKDLIFSLNSADVHWCVNAKGIKGVSCPSKAYGIMAVGKPIIGVLESRTEVRTLIEKADCGRCCDPGDYSGIEECIRWYIEHAESGVFFQMGMNGRKYLETNLTKEISIEKYKDAILAC